MWVTFLNKTRDPAAHFAVEENVQVDGIVDGGAQERKSTPSGARECRGEPGDVLPGAQLAKLDPCKLQLRAPQWWQNRSSDANTDDVF